jgi:hypothetical protein
MSDDQIGVSKGLGWTIAVALIGGGFFVGTEISTYRLRTELDTILSSVENLVTIQGVRLDSLESWRTEIEIVRESRDDRIRDLEQWRAGSLAEITAIRDSILRIERSISRQEQESRP